MDGQRHMPEMLKDREECKIDRHALRTIASIPRMENETMFFFSMYHATSSMCHFSLLFDRLVGLISLIAMQSSTMLIMLRSYLISSMHDLPFGSQTFFTDSVSSRLACVSGCSLMRWPMH